MPVPLPSPDLVKQTPPDATEARMVAGAVAAAVAAGGRLTSLQRLMIESLMESMTGFVVPANHVPRIGPEEFARALATRDEAFRHRMVHFMLLCSLVLVPLPEEVVQRVEAYARELGVDDSMRSVADRYAHGSPGAPSST